MTSSQGESADLNSIKCSNLMVIGHSHLGAMQDLFRSGGGLGTHQIGKDDIEIVSAHFLPILKDEFIPHLASDGKINQSLQNVIHKFFEGDLKTIQSHVTSFGTFDPSKESIIVSFIGGNAYNLIGLLNDQYVIEEKSSTTPLNAELVSTSESIKSKLRSRISAHLAVLRYVAENINQRIFIPAPLPPIESAAKLSQYLPSFLIKDGAIPQVAPSWYRRALRENECASMKEFAHSIGAVFIETPKPTLDGGFLRAEYQKETDAIHANAAYAKLLLKDILSNKVGGTHPYSNLPDVAYWRRSIAKVAGNAVEPVANFPIKIQKSDKIVTAGSCFAQEIAQRLQSAGYAYHVTEKPDVELSETEVRQQQYGVYSARYGNIYTTRQLLQLFERAHGFFKPIEQFWAANGRVFDVFRPTIPSDGFSSIEDAKEAQARHFEAVRRCFKEADVFIFTLGLTEAFEDIRDGTVFPVCPGIVAGTYDAAHHKFKNFTVSEIVEDFLKFDQRLRSINPRVRTIITVSPVPLIATASGRHVLEATSYSKSVLRVAAEIISSRLPHVGYFPSYEIITGAHAKGRYFEEDLRSVTRIGVDHVMRTFFHHAIECETEQSPLEQSISQAIKVICEEELLDLE